MSNPEQTKAINRDRDGIVASVIESWAAINLLRGFREAAENGLADQHPHCISAMYSAAFSSLYSSVAAIVDVDDGVHSLPRLVRRLRAVWSSQPEMLQLLDRISDEISSHETLGRLNAWRNKVIAHRTPKALDPSFYEVNKASIEEISSAIVFIEQRLNEISVNFDGTIVHGLESACGVLPRDVLDVLGGSPC